MSLYQCDKCGVVENTALGAYWCNQFWEENSEVAASYREQLGLKQNMWHGQFEKKFYPLGTMDTDEQGNLRKKNEKISKKKGKNRS
jgi:hypothetical protein